MKMSKKHKIRNKIRKTAICYRHRHTVINHYEILSVMRKNQTARSETGFNGYPKEATAMDIMLFIDYVALRRPSSSSGHGTVFFTRQQDQQYKRYLFTPEVTDCLRLTLKMVININLYCETYALCYMI